MTEESMKCQESRICEQMVSSTRRDTPAVGGDYVQGQERECAITRGSHLQCKEKECAVPGGSCLHY